MQTRTAPLRAAFRRLAVRVAWLGVAVLISLGVAGIAAAMTRAPGTAARAELTWPGDAAARPVLAAAETSLRALQEEVAALGSLGRLAVTALSAADQDAINDAVAEGTVQLERVEAAVATYRTNLEAVPGIGTRDEVIRLSQDLRDRYDVLVATVRETDDLASDWRVLTQEALNAGRLSGLLQDHDRVAGEAVQAGSGAEYGRALQALDVASERLDAAGELRDALAERLDVTTLDRWLERNDAYDNALRELYGALRDSGGAVNQRVRDAVAAERAARERLPEDTRALVIIMAEVARGGLNQAVISIEETRGALGEALIALQGLSASPEIRSG